MTLSVADLTGNAVAVSANGLVDASSAQSGALAALRDHLFLAQGHPGGIRVLRFAGAKTTINITPVDTVELKAGALGLTDFGGAQVSMAAARDRVAVMWLNKPQLAGGEATGGWALLRCSI